MQRGMARVAVLAFAQSSAVLAQATPGGGVPRSATKGSDEIVVSTDREAARSLIDRKVYAVAHDLQSVSGSVADILHNLPSVDVDADGNVSIRGDSNVQILIDGKPSTSVSAARRGETLQALPANGIESIEVITNPSAQYRPDGATGIINIITRKNAAPGISGSAIASIGTDGRFNLGSTLAYRAGRLSLNGGLTIKRDRPYRPFGDQRTQADAAGLVTDSRQTGVVRSNRLSRIVDAGVDYDLTPADRLSASGSYNARTGTPEFYQANRIATAAGAVVTDFTRIGTGHEREIYSEATAKYRHSFAAKGHELTLDLRRSETAETQRRRFTDTFAIPPGLVTIDQQEPHSDAVERGLTAEYARPLAGGGLVLIGYDLQRDDDRYDNRATVIDSVTARSTIDPALTNSFRYGQTVHAAYATYNSALSKRLTAIFGARVEATFTETLVPLTGQNDSNSYYRFYPTVHLNYALSDTQTLRLSYSHRIVRPEPDDLDPYPIFNNPLNLRAGNPKLLPQETDAVEGSLQYAAHGLSVELTPYVRNSRNLFTDFVTQISPTVLLTTRQNLGTSLAAGSEIAVSGKAKALSYSLSGNVYFNRIDAANLGINVARSIVSFSAKGSVDYRLTPRDTVQFSVNYTGKRLVPQGYRAASVGSNFGFRHQLRPGLSAVVTVTDVFDSLKDRLVIDTGSVHDIATRRRAQRTANFGLNWTFGGKKAAATPKFDYTE